MKEAIKKASSIAKGGKKISAQNADYDTYAKELIVCPECGSGVFLKAKKSAYMEAHWAHFPGTGMNCVAKSKPQLIKPVYNRQSEREFHKQCLAIFKTKLSQILLYAYYQEGVDKILEHFGRDWKAGIISLGDEAAKVASLPYPRDWMRRVYPLMKNVTATSEIVDLFFEEIVTNPMLAEALQVRLAERKNDWDDSFIVKIKDSSFTQAEMILHRNILIELMKYFSTPESVDIFAFWVSLNFVQLSQSIDGVGYALFSLYPAEQLMVFLSLYNICIIDWAKCFEKLRKEEKPEVYAVSTATLTPILPYLDFINDLTPIRVSSIKGFGRKN